MENDSRGSREHKTVGESYKDIVETGWINSNSRGSREHKTEDGREAGGIGELLVGKPQTQDRRDRRNLWEKLQEM